VDKFHFEVFFLWQNKNKNKTYLTHLEAGSKQKKMIKIKNKKFTSRLQIIVKNQYKYPIKILFEKWKFCGSSEEISDCPLRQFHGAADCLLWKFRTVHWGNSVEQQTVYCGNFGLSIEAISWSSRLFTVEILDCPLRQFHGEADCLLWKFQTCKHTQTWAWCYLQLITVQIYDAFLHKSWCINYATKTVQVFGHWLKVFHNIDTKSKSTCLSKFEFCMLTVRVVTYLWVLASIYIYSLRVTQFEAFHTQFKIIHSLSVWH